MKALLMVFVGGGLGSISRYLIYRVINNTSFSIPIGTLTVNIIGSLLLGIILGYALKEEALTSNTLLFLTTGFCGGFTTFSTFAFENQELLRAGDYMNFALYAFGSLLAGIIAITIGLLISRLL